jgi:hypothetical protein
MRKNPKSDAPLPTNIDVEAKFIGASRLVVGMVMNLMRDRRGRTDEEIHRSLGIRWIGQTWSTRIQTTPNTTRLARLALSNVGWLHRTMKLKKTSNGGMARVWKR